MSNRTPTTNASADDHTLSWAVTAALDRPLDHERDDVELLEQKCRRYFTSDPMIYRGDGDADVVEATVDGDEGVLQVVVEGDQHITRRMGVLALRRQVLPKYNDETNQEVPPSLGLVGDALETDQKPRTGPTDETISNEEWEEAQERAAELEEELGPDSAPDVVVQEDSVDVRTVQGAPPPLETDGGPGGGDEGE